MSSVNGPLNLSNEKLHDVQKALLFASRTAPNLLLIFLSTVRVKVDCSRLCTPRGWYLGQTAWSVLGHFLKIRHCRMIFQQSERYHINYRPPTKFLSVMSVSLSVRKRGVPHLTATWTCSNMFTWGHPQQDGHLAIQALPHWHVQICIPHYRGTPWNQMESVWSSI